MPRISDGETRRIVLEGDKDKTPEPYFEYRLLTHNEFKKSAAIQDKIDGGGLSAVESMELLESAATRGLIGWANITDATGAEIAFGLESFGDILTPFEMMELLTASLMANNQTLEQKKTAG